MNAAEGRWIAKGQVHLHDGPALYTEVFWDGDDLLWPFPTKHDLPFLTDKELHDLNEPHRKHVRRRVGFMESIDLAWASKLLRRASAVEAKVRDRR